MPFQIKKDATDITRYIMVVDSGDGTPETAVTITEFDMQYTRFGVAPVTKVDATALAATDSTHADSKMFEIDATSSPGLYRVDWPDAAFATGVDGVVLVVSGTGFHPSVEIVHLVDFDPQSASDLGLSSVTSILADTAEIGTAGAGLSDLGGMSTAMKAEVNVEADGAFATWAPPTKTEMDTAHALLATPANVATELATYDGPTDAEMVARTLLAADYFDPAADAVADVTLVATTTTNTDMVAAAPTAGANADAVWDEAIASHVAAGSFGEEVQLHALSSEISASAIADQVWDEAKSGHVAAGSMGEEIQSHALTTEVTALNDLSTAEVATELATYDSPTKSEMDSGFAALNDPTASENAIAVWDEAKAGHVGAGSFGEEVQSHALTTEVTALNDLSTAEVATELATYDAPTKSEMDSAHALLATPSQVNTEVVDVLTVDTNTELASIPTWPATILDMVKWIYSAMRHKLDSSNTSHKVYKDDASTALGTSVISDSAGTTTRGEFS